MGKLTSDLENLANKSKEQLAESIQETMSNDINDIKEKDILANVIKVGDKLPESKLLDVTNEEINLNSTPKRMVIMFYRGGWCPYCNLELAQYQKHLEEITGAGAELVAISPELPDESLNTKEKNELKFKVLTDVNNKFADSLGLVHTLTPELAELYDSFGFDVTAKQGTEEARLPLPATLIVNEAKEVEHIFVNVDYKKRMDPVDVVAFLKK